MGSIREIKKERPARQITAFHIWTTLPTSVSQADVNFPANVLPSGFILSTVISPRGHGAPGNLEIMGLFAMNTLTQVSGI